jgi:hypothetical protein
VRREYRICLVALSVGSNKYPRPATILGIVDDDLDLLPISSRMELYDAAEHFLVAEDDPDFAATGLKHDSYILPKVTPVAKKDIHKIIGELKGELAERFNAWYYGASNPAPRRRRR